MSDDEQQQEVVYGLALYLHGQQDPIRITVAAAGCDGERDRVLEEAVSELAEDQLGVDVVAVGRGELGWVVPVEAAGHRLGELDAVAVGVWAAEPALARELDT